MVMHNRNILLCGGYSNEKYCLQLDYGLWKVHSKLNEKRIYHSSATTESATFIFGGHYSRKTYEYLPKDSTTWLLGKTKIPGEESFQSGCAIAIKSKQEIWLFGGSFGRYGSIKEDRIIRFNVNDHTFEYLPFKMRVGRSSHCCAYIPNTNKVMITGGYIRSFLDSTEIIDTENGHVTLASPMNYKRACHGMGVIKVNGEDRLAVFGGKGGNFTWLDSVELYNTSTGKWENSDIKLKTPMSNFASLDVKLEDIISKV